MKTVLHPRATEPSAICAVHRGRGFLCSDRFEVVDRVAKGYFIPGQLFFDRAVAV